MEMKDLIKTVKYVTTELKNLKYYSDRDEFYTLEEKMDDLACETGLDYADIIDLKDSLYLKKDVKKLFRKLNNCSTVENYTITNDELKFKSHFLICIMDVKVWYSKKEPCVYIKNLKFIKRNLFGCVIGEE